jgi:MFS family permease
LSWKKFKNLKSIFSSLYSRNYRIYFVGQGISLIGTWMQQIALSWLVYRLTGSVFLLGLIGFTSQIPVFILSPFTGVITDRFNRLSIMKLSQWFFMIHALIMAMLVLLNLIEVWHIIALSVVFGVVSAFDAPARQSLVIDLIDNPNDLGNAIALNSAIFNGARLIGPAIAGITIAIVGEGICFLINTISYIAVIIALQYIKIEKKQIKTEQSKFFKSFTEGFKYTFQSLPIKTLIILLAILSLVGLPYIILLPAYAKEILHGESDTLGYLMSSMGAGALIAALYMASRKSVVGLGKIISVNIILLGLGITMAAFSKQLYLSSFVFFLTGLAMIFTLSSVNTLLQTITTEDKRGRVMSFYSMALMGIYPLGNLLVGSVASGIGIPSTLLIMGFITILSGFLFSKVIYSLREDIHHIYRNKGLIPGISDDLN